MGKFEGDFMDFEEEEIEEHEEVEEEEEEEGDDDFSEDPSDDEGDNPGDLDADEEDLENEEPADEEVAEDEEEADEEEVSEIAQLKAQMAVLSAKLEKAESVEEEEEDKAPYAPFQSEEFTTLVDEMSWDKDEAKAFQTFFAGFIQKNNEILANHTLKAAVTKVDKQTAVNARNKTVAKNFYESNPALANVKPFVKHLASAVAQEMPGLSMEKILEETARRAYKDLQIKKPKKGAKKVVGKKKASAKDKPAFGNRKGSRRAGKKKTGSKLQKDLDAVLEGLNV